MKAKRKGRPGPALIRITESLGGLIHTEGFVCRARLQAGDFTRNRKMGFTELIAFMTNQVKTSTQTALDRFFALIGEPDTRMTQQSFSEARQKLNPEACRELFLHTVSQIYACETNKWHGRTVIAVDGSKLQLPDDARLLKTFGGTGRGASSPVAQASVAYDMLNGVIADAEIEPLSVDERSLAERHVRRIAAMPELSGALLIFDRGYPSFKLMSLIKSEGLAFLMRLRTKFDLDIDALGCGVHHHVLRRGDEELAVVIAKFALPNGEIETLVTNLTDARMGIKAFKKLYFMRWPVETKYGEMKLKLEIENFSGRTEIAVRQDFFITAMLSNLVSVAAREAQPAVDKAREGKDNKHRYKVNVNHAIGTFKDRFVLALLDPNHDARAAKTNAIVRDLCRHAVPEIKGRSVPRNPSPRKAKFHHNMKSNC
jgi:hypothetical protein